MTKTLNRKERRALQFGTLEARTAIETKLKLREPFFVVADAEQIVIPVIQIGDLRIAPFMMPYQDIPEVYRSSIWPSPRNQDVGTAKTPADYQSIMTIWFYCGLTQFDPVLRPNVVVEGSHPREPGLWERALRRYLSTILNDRDISHEHKMDYAAYVCDACCTEIFWTASS